MGGSGGPGGHPLPRSPRRHDTVHRAGAGSACPELRVVLGGDALGEPGGQRPLHPSLLSSTPQPLSWKAGGPRGTEERGGQSLP